MRALRRLIAGVDYRHVIGWLVRKPGAFVRYRYREDLFPTVTFRRAFDALQTTHGERADVEYLRILQLAALHGDVRVTDALRAVLDAGRFDYVAVQQRVAPHADDSDAPPAVPDLRVYDALLVGVPA